MTLSEFASYTAARSIERITYTVDNNSPMNGVGFNLYFDRAICCHEIRELFLIARNETEKNKRNSMTLYGVTGIKLTECSYYDAAEITCQRDGETYRHTLVIDYK